MKALANEFRKSGFDFKLLLRDGNVALLRKTKPGLSFESYEVVRVQRHNGYQIAGKKIPPAEMMPSSYNLGNTRMDVHFLRRRVREVQSTERQTISSHVSNARNLYRRLYPRPRGRLPVVFKPHSEAMLRPIA